MKKKLICTCLVTLSLIGANINPVKAITNNSPTEVFDSKGKEAKVFTSSDAHQNATGVKTSVSVSFIEDPNNSNLTALVSIKGFIPSGLTKYGGYWDSGMNWTSKYNVTVESQNNDKVKIIESIPSNKIETVKVSETIGYSVGGDVSANKDTASGGLNAGYSVQRSISYDQPDFKTIQKADEIRKTSWDIEFNATRDGYDKNSYHAIYGNQLFMKSRLHNTGFNNLTDDKDLSPLISGGFTPDMAIALKAPKDTEKSTLRLNYNRYPDIYCLKWNTTQWWGENISISNPIPTVHYYEIDWKNHTINKI